MLTLKDYANQNNISYESVRKQVNKYQIELGENIIKKGRVKYLNKAAIKFLDEKRNIKNISEVSTKENQVKDIISVLKKENEFLKEQLAEKDRQLKEKDIQIQKEQDIRLREQELRLISEKKFLLLSSTDDENEITEKEVYESSHWWQFWK